MSNIETTPAQPTPIPERLIRRAIRAAHTAHDMAGTDGEHRARGVVDGMIFAVEAMGCAESDIDAMCDRIDNAMRGEK